MLVDRFGNAFEKISTTEQDTGEKWIDGSHIYTKTIDVGQLFSGQQVHIKHGINIGHYIVVDPSYSYAFIDGLYINIPKPDVNANNAISLFVSNTEIVITCGSGASANSCVVTLRYTKA